MYIKMVSDTMNKKAAGHFVYHIYYREVKEPNSKQNLDCSHSYFMFSKSSADWQKVWRP